MKKVISLVTRFYQIAINSIVFYPSVIALLFFFFALLMLYYEYSPIILSIKQKISVVLVKGPDNARVILNNVIGGVISLTVFSFSMVMLVLSQASSAYSPRVIPGLITRKSHQVVLGFYLGTIVYSFMLVINLNPNASTPQVAGMGILFCMLFGIGSLALFVYFIHSISTTIQIDNVLNDIYKDTFAKIKFLKELSEQQHDTKNWYVINSIQAGYFRDLRQAALCRLLKEKDLKIEVQWVISDFIVKEKPFIKVNKTIDEKTANQILNECIIETREAFGEHYIYGFKQISEVAVKALSPGINDPGTAQKAIDLLSILLIEKVLYRGVNIAEDQQGNIRIICQEVTLEKLLQQYIMPIHHYGKEDIQIIAGLLKAFHNMLMACHRNQKEFQMLVTYLQSIITDAEQTIQNTIDRKLINPIISEINKEIGHDSVRPL